LFNSNLNSNWGWGFSDTGNSSSSSLLHTGNSGSSNYGWGSSGYGDDWYIKYTAFTGVEKENIIVSGSYSMEKKLYTGIMFGDQDSPFGVTTYPDKSPSYSIGDFGFNSTGVILPFGSNTTIGFSIKGPSISFSTTFSSQTNPSMVSRDVTTYSLTPFVDNLRDSLSTSYSTNPYNKIGPLPLYWYVYP
jgi:hypothetical protein